MNINKGVSNQKKLILVTSLAESCKGQLNRVQCVEGKDFRVQSLCHVTTN